MALASSLLFTFSCKKDEDDTSTTTNSGVVDTETSKTSVRSSMTSMSTEFSDITSNPGFKAGSSILSLIDDASINQRKKKAGTTFEDINTFELEYNPTLDDFDTLSTDASHLIIHFPSEEGGVENNATLNVYDLQFSDATEENLTEIDLDIIVDKLKVVDVDVSITYDFATDIDLKTFTGAVTFGTYSMIADFGALSNAITVSASFLNDQVSILDFSVKADFSNAIYESLNKVDGHVALFDMNIKGDVNVEDIENNIDAIEENVDKVNDYINVGMYNFATGDKYGDLKVDGSGDGDVLIVYEDGSSESVIALASGLIEDVEAELQ